MIVKKFNYYRFFVFIAIVSAIVVGAILYVKKDNYNNSYEYKLSNVGYSEEEINKIKSKLNDKQIDKLLTVKYDKNIIDFFDEKYFLFKNISKYISYKNESKIEDNSKIVAIINSEANIEWFDNEKETDISKGNLMLVNRLYGLSKDYVPEEIVSVPSQYAYTGKKISNLILNNIISLIEAGKEEGYTFVVSDGYRSYDEQKKLYDNYASSYGMSEADKIVAKPGHSEYQTGISFDLMPYNKVIADVSKNEEYLWLRENAHKYGFIFRFESDKESLTGFKASSWRLRYVGSDAASIMYSEKICFEEYYAYFVEEK